MCPNSWPDGRRASAWPGQLLRRVLTRISAVSRKTRAIAPESLPMRGYAEYSHRIVHVDRLSDQDLAELNELLHWHAFTVDSHGRRFGGAAWRGKRDHPQVVPDPRILRMDARFDLRDKHVLEFGCFEGIHTVALAQLGARVTAVDGRIENVVKTIVRAAMYGCSPTVFKYDVEQFPAEVDLLRADVLHHVGVLYHLADPVRHLLELGRYIREGMLLDTHYALDVEAQQSYEVDERVFRFKPYRELGRQDVFSGLSDHSKWLRLDDIVELVRETGFSEVHVETRNERNGPRATLLASRS
jgi:2-polyprenyl-3-methyl-5-hydroxy-6-metoxy-1,4-benzoquinol methylase